MEENEALEHKLPKVDSYDANSYHEGVASQQMEVPSTSQPQAQSTQAPQDQTAQATTFGTSMPAITSDVAQDPNALVAEDVDLIEKAWVEKAKAIVQSTTGDPYSQNRELSKVKAEYIKKRYDKDIKVSE